ncbi:hypothetical protein ABT224_02205 [Streptomyces sp. NPDC001584]|uniref:hypothetical protein n=1 Tax=Streptomyces sp. NPDC001584 TaxID=3154521 RepID=UPI0033207B41
MNDPNKGLPSRAWKWILGVCGVVATGVIVAWLTGLFSTGEATILNKPFRLGINSEEAGPLLNVGVKPGVGGECEEEVSQVYPYPPSHPLMNVAPGSGPQKNGKTWDEDPRAFGAIPAGPAWLTVALTTDDDRSVIITNVVFHAVDSKPGLKGTVVEPERGCGNGVTYHVGRVDFDRKPPYWSTVPADFHSGWRADDLKFPYKASKSDPAYLFIEVDPGSRRRSWYAEIYWKDGEVSGKSRIPKSGEFEMTPSDGLPVKKKLYVAD